MNNKEVLKIFKEVMKQYNEFCFHRKFISELLDLLKDMQGHEKEFFSLFIKQLEFINTLGTNIHQADSNEILKYQEKTYYSLHAKGKNFNIRLLMTFNEDYTPVFLAAFYERSGKSKTNYSSWIDVLEQRFQETI